MQRRVTVSGLAMTPLSLVATIVVAHAASLLPRVPAADDVVLRYWLPENRVSAHRIADAIHRIQEHDTDLGQHLSRAVRTGAYLSYLPERARR
jgi:hypothetical protein